jgi:RNA 2',3'-cyclic 3'-phosphodiesterase
MKPPDESWRLFIAIELPSSVRRRVQDHINQLREAVPEARASWIREENLHLTIRFLGDTPVTKVEALSQAIQRAAHQVSAFELVIGGCGTFPSRGQPRVLWIGIEDPTNNQTNLQRALEDEGEKAGFPREARPFHPHLTVGRLRQPLGARRLGQLHQDIGFDPVSVNISDVCLIRSELRSEGSRYTVLSRHEFQ